MITTGVESAIHGENKLKPGLATKENVGDEDERNVAEGMFDCIGGAAGKKNIN